MNILWLAVGKESAFPLRLMITDDVMTENSFSLAHGEHH